MYLFSPNKTDHNEADDSGTHTDCLLSQSSKLFSFNSLNFNLQKLIVGKERRKRSKKIAPF